MTDRENPVGKLTSLDLETCVVGINGKEYLVSEKPAQYLNRYKVGDDVEYNIGRSSQVSYLRKLDSEFRTGNTYVKSTNPGKPIQLASSRQVKPFVLQEELEEMDEIFREVHRTSSIWEGQFSLKFSSEDLRAMTVTLYIEKKKR